MFPIVRYVDFISGDANGRNWPGLVHLKRGLRLPAAVLAQEAWESMHKMDPVKLIYRVFKRDDKDRREFEYMGHECEVQAAAFFYDVDPNNYRMAEARRMRNGYDGLFRHLTPDQIADEMKARTKKANRWMLDNLEHLRKYE